MTLTRFTKIRAKLSEYALALKPYQDAAANLLKELSEETVEETTNVTVAHEALLDAIGVENVHSPEGFALLEEVNKHYPMQIQWGLVGHQYYIDTSENDGVRVETKQEEGTDPGANESRNRKDINRTDDPNTRSMLMVAETETESEVNIVADDATIIIDSAAEESVLVPVEIDTSADTFLSKTISPINKIKAGTPSASSFRKEIIKIGRINPELKIVLPLLTNVGVLTKKQAFLFGVCMDCFVETDKTRNSVEICIDTLAQKGYLSCYKYDIEDYDKEVYCLSNYCYSCLRKDSISVQMKGFWELSFGKYKFIGDGNMQPQKLTRGIKKNSDLLQYLYSVKDVLDEKEYQIVKESIHFENDHYYVAVIDRGETKKCILLSEEDEIIDTSEAEILLCVENEIVPETVNESTSTIYLFCKGTVISYKYVGGKLQTNFDGNTETENDIIDENLIEDKTQKVTLVEQILGKDDSTDEVVIKETPEIKSDTEEEILLTPVSEDTIPDGTKKGILDEIVDPAKLLKMKNAPSDEEFCALISQLLTRPAATKDQLTSVVVQSVLLANGAALEKGRPQAKRYADQLKLATHLLLGDAPYSSEHLTAAFSNPEEENKALLLSAILFAMLNPSVSYDYGLRNQTEMFFNQYEHYFGKLGAFKPLFNKLMLVQNVATTGFSPATIALLGSAAESEAFIDGLRKEANNYLVVQSPKTRMKALPLLYNNCFGSGSDLYECMKIISDDKQDHDSIEYVETILLEYCNRQNDTFSLNSGMVEERLTAEWDKINAKNKFKLEYDAHDRAIRQFTSRLELMLTWDEQMGNLNKREQDISRLRVLKQEILGICTDIQKDGTWKKERYANVLSWLLLFMKDYLNGEYSRLHIYSELLLTGAISVDDEGSPNIDSTMAEIRYFEPWRNALRHVLAEKRNVEEVKAEILGDNINSLDDETGLKDNLHQLKMLGKLVESLDDDYVITEGQLREATESADERTVHFKETLELAYTYNQINENEKETLSGIMARYKNDFYAIMDFANWRRFLEALEHQITEYATGRKAGLRSKLDLRLTSNPNSIILLEADRLLEEDMNLAVTEEYLNRYDAGETEFDDGTDLVLHDSDYFEDFLKHENFDKILQECRRNDGRALKTFGWNYLEKNLPQDWTSRLRDDSKTMVTSWPSRRDATSIDQIKTLFTCLGLNVVQIFKIKGRKEEMFQLTVNPTPKSMADYRHPIAAFGTQLKSPMSECHCTIR